MELLIWIGAVLTVCGLLGLFWCIRLAMKARAEGLTGPAMQARLQRVVALNMAALAVSALGLIAVVVGVILG